MRENLAHNKPIAFSREAQNAALVEGRGLNSEIVLLGELEQQKLDGIIEILAHPELQAMIEGDKISFGAIKPRAHESKLGVETDDEAEKVLLGMIKPPLEVIFTISLVPTPEDMEFFYSNVKTLLSGREKDGVNEWEEFKNYMTSGPITYFLLYDPDENAVGEWRKQMGATNPQNADPETIRGRFASSIRKNLVHGSSGETRLERVGNVKKETKWLHDKLESIRAKTSPDSVKDFPTEEILREMGILTDKDELISVRRLGNPYRSGAETYLSPYALFFKDKKGQLQVRYVAQKSIVSMGGNPELKAQDRLRRLKFLKDKGVNTPEIYGAARADVFEEYIVGARDVKDGIQAIKSVKTDDKLKAHLLSQLVKAAVVLDKNGFRVVGNFYENIIFNGKDFYFVDSGFDIGDPNSQESNQACKKVLLGEFQNSGLVDLIEEIYSRELTSLS